MTQPDERPVESAGTAEAAAAEAGPLVEQLVADRSRPGSPRRTPRCGARTPSPRRRSGSRGRRCTRRRGRWCGEIEALRRRAARRGRRPGRARRHGRLVAGAGGDHEHRRRAAGRARHHRPRPGRRRARRRPVRARCSWCRPSPGSTVETDSHRRIFEKAFADAGIDAASRIVVVTDPGSPLEAAATEAGYRQVFPADPNVGGRYSALTAFGLVPAGLAGADIGAAARRRGRRRARAGRRRRATTRRCCWPPRSAPRTPRGAEKVVLADTGSGINGFGDWAEQLIAESTGKNGTGLLPVVVEGPDAPGFADAASDATPVAIGPPPTARCWPPRAASAGCSCCGSTRPRSSGGCSAINPFDQPDVEAAKKAARSLLDAPASDAGTPAFVDGPVEVHADGLAARRHEHARRRAAPRSSAASRTFGYLVRAGLPRPDRRRVGRGAAPGARAPHRPCRPRSAGARGSCTPPASTTRAATRTACSCSSPARSSEDLEVPGRPYTLGTLQLAQALGDGQVLAERGRPVLRLHFTDRAAGLGAPGQGRSGGWQRDTHAGRTRCATSGTSGCPDRRARAAW